MAGDAVESLLVAVLLSACVEALSDPVAGLDGAVGSHEVVALPAVDAA